MGVVSEHTEMSSGPTTPPIDSSEAAERMRAHRSRRRAGLSCLMIEIFEAEIDAPCVPLRSNASKRRLL
jgi:hypothetical protein